MTLYSRLRRCVLALRLRRVLVPHLSAAVDDNRIPALEQRCAALLLRPGQLRAELRDGNSFLDSIIRLGHPAYYRGELNSERGGYLGNDRAVALVAHLEGIPEEWMAAWTE